MSEALSRLMTEEEVAEYLKVTIAGVRRWRLEGMGPPYRKLGKPVRYLREEVEAWVENCPRGQKPAPAPVKVRRRV